MPQFMVPKKRVFNNENTADQARMRKVVQLLQRHRKALQVREENLYTNLRVEVGIDT
jgi:hypothetical protein